MDDAKVESKTFNTSKPPNEEWVEVLLADGVIKIAMAFYGRDGYMPHWRTPDGSCYSVSSVLGWYYNGDICPTSGEKDCSRCSGEYCAKHFNKPCDCDVVSRHRPY